MATVFIPPQMRDLTGGAVEVVVDGHTLRQVIAAVDSRFPGLAARLRDGDRLAPGLAASIDGVITSHGMFARVQPHSEIHFLPALGGG